MDVLAEKTDAPLDWAGLRDPAGYLGAADRLIDRVLAALPPAAAPKTWAQADLRPVFSLATITLGSRLEDRVESGAGVNSVLEPRSEGDCSQ